MPGKILGQAHPNANVVTIPATQPVRGYRRFLERFIPCSIAWQRRGIAGLRRQEFRELFGWELGVLIKQITCCRLVLTDLKEWGWCDSAFVHRKRTTRYEPATGMSFAQLGLFC